MKIIRSSGTGQRDKDSGLYVCNDLLSLLGSKGLENTQL